MKVELIGYDGRVYTMPTVLRWRLLRTGQVPCDDLEVTCVYDGTLLGVMPEISRFRATENGVTALSGVVDEYAAAATEEGLLLTVSGRGMAALLLDNEAEAATYQDTTTAEILRNHAAPYGIVCRRARELVCGGSYQVKSGSSQWKALSGFTHFTGGFVPYFTASGELVAEPMARSGQRLVIDGGTPVLRCTRREKRYGVLSEVLVKDKTRKTEQRVVNRPFLDRGGCRRQVLYTPGRSSYAAMRYTGSYQIEQSAQGSSQIEVKLPGALAAEPGDWVELSYGPLGLSGTYDVVSAESRGGPEGAATTIILEEP